MIDRKRRDLDVANLERFPRADFMMSFSGEFVSSGEKSTCQHHLGSALTGIDWYLGPGVLK
jgi:hypothetical protein